MATFSFEDAQNIPQGGGTFSFEDAQAIAPRQQPMDLPRDAQGRLKLGADAFGDTLRDVLKGTDWGTRNIAGFGTALSDIVEGVKQFVGKGDRQQIEANKIIADEAPVGAIAGNAAMTAIPFGLAGNSVGSAAKVGTVLGALQPVSGDQTAANIVRGKIINAAEGGALAAGGQKVANMAGDYVVNKAADLAAKKVQNAPLTKTLNDAMDAGFVVPPSSAEPTLWNEFKEGIAGKIGTAQQASNRNAEVANALARKSVGMAPDEALTSDAMRQIRANAYTAGYEPVAQIGTVQTDGAFQKALDSLVSKYQGASKSFPGAFKDEVAQQVDALRVPQFDASDAIQAAQLLRDNATASFRAGNAGLGQAQKGAAKAIEDQLERALAASGQNGQQLLDNFRAARQLMAKAHTVEDAIVEGGGSIDPRKLAARVQAGKPMTGELGVIGNFANNFPKATQPAKQVAGPSVSKLGFYGSAPLAVVGSALGPLGTIAGMAAPFVVPPAMRARLLSKSSQNALRDIYKVGLGTRLGARALQYAPVGSTVLGLQALGQ